MLVKLARRLFGRATPVSPLVADDRSSPVPMAAPEPVARVAPRRVTVTASTPRRRHRRQQPAPLPASLHARRLLHWCQTEGGGTGEFLASEIIDIYLNQCAYDGLEPLSWQAVANALRPLTGGKRYKWVVREDGRHRLRVYRIPPLPACADSTFLEFGAWQQAIARPAPVRLRRAA